jgi:tRNA(Ile)-lysidine synthase TilS/MesJ
LDSDGICSACKAYERHRPLLENHTRLRRLLAERLKEAAGDSGYAGIAACSGGKDSTFMLLRLQQHYGARMLAVMDELNQQNDEANANYRRVAARLGVDTDVIPAPDAELEIRQNFLRAGSSFCRLCLRSHLVRIYALAVERRIP